MQAAAGALSSCSVRANGQRVARRFRSSATPSLCLPLRVSPSTTTVRARRSCAPAPRAMADDAAASQLVRRSDTPLFPVPKDLALIGAYVLLSLNAILRSPLKVPYSYHPLGVTAFVAFTSAAVATSQRLRGAVSGAVRKSTVLLHGTFSFLALLSLAAAQVAIYLSKESLSRPHLTSSHGKLGALGGLFFVLTMMAGSALVLAPKLFPKVVKPHRLFGYVVYGLVVANHALAVSNGYLTRDGVEKAALLVLLAAQAALTFSGIKPAMLPFGSALTKPGPAAGH